MSDNYSGYLSRRTFFLIISVVLMLLATNRFSGDIWAFMWSVLMTSGVFYLGE